MKKMYNIKVFEKGNFYDETNKKDITEKEFHDCDISYIIQDRTGRFGIIIDLFCGMSIHWIDEDDPNERYRVEYNNSF